MDRKELCIEMSFYMIENKATVRETAEVFYISKSTVHNYVTSYLKEINLGLAEEVKKVLLYNKKERAMRGGIATREKWRRLKSGR